MSDEPQALERSTLQKKDRAELITIATAMGAKPGSRVKKADVVDLILELAGVTGDPAGGPGSAVQAPGPAPSATGEVTAGDAEASPAIGPESSAETGGEAGGEPPVGARPEVDAGDGVERPTREAGGNGAVTDTGRAGDRTGASGGTQRPSREGSQTSRAAPSQGSGEHSGGRPSRGGQQGSGQQGSGQQGSGQQGSGQQGSGQQGSGQQVAQHGGDQPSDDDTDGDSANRRRRRRGRDRDRGPQEDQPFQGEPMAVEGLLDLRDEGYGFLRVNGYLPSSDDVYVSVKQSRQFALRKGDRIVGGSRPPSRNEKNPALLRIDSVNGQEPDEARQRPKFDTLTPLFPDSKLQLESRDDPYNMTTRIIDLIAPIGKGQRGLIVSPPKAGKTTVMKQIVRSIETNHPEAHLMVLLVDERPEEVTDMRRWVKKGEVAASTFDRPSDEHTQVAELVIERAKRLVETGLDVVVILDGITRLARAYNLSAPPTGRVMSGGVDSGALYPPKKFFGAARNVEEGGSLTILATALVETGSRMDEVIFEEFKGTGNMELRLDRRLAERRIYPAIDVEGSSTRHEELLFTPKELQQVWKLRRVLSGMAAESGNHGAGLDLLTDRMKTFRSNEAFLSEIAKGTSGH